jgi:hypothetical protein
MSEIAKKLTGTYIPDDQSPKPPVAAWLQDEVRRGRFSSLVKKFASAQQEALDPSLVQVDAVNESAILCHIPCCVCDRESRSPFRFDVEFELNPLTGNAVRRI